MSNNVVKAFPLESCSRCPNKIAVKQCSEPILVTACYAANNRALPYNIDIGIAYIKYANPTNVIPEWCPLEDLKV